MKICTDCNQKKELNRYYSQKKKNKSGVEYVYYQPYCKECAVNRSIKWQVNNYSRHRKNQRNFDKTTKRKENYKNNSKSRRDNGKYYEWLKKNNYSYEKFHKQHDITEEEWLRCKAYFEYSCAYCGVSVEEHLLVTGQDLHKEHVIHDGSNGIENCVPACRKCNSEKWAFEFDDWYSESNVNYDQDRKNKIINWITNDYKLN
ncbi:HNH endonuclease [Heyndrickxia oleronia]|uniref:HNH endonuclease n=1 Tax=Heyndrickxia oleronia TaxID=38875 RepID=UPI003F29F29F